MGVETCLAACERASQITDDGFAANLERTLLRKGISRQRGAVGVLRYLYPQGLSIRRCHPCGTQHRVLGKHFVINLGDQIVLAVLVAAPNLAELNRLNRQWDSLFRFAFLSLWIRVPSSDGLSQLRTVVRGGLRRRKGAGTMERRLSQHGGSEPRVFEWPEALFRDNPRRPDGRRARPSSPRLKQVESREKHGQLGRPRTATRSKKIRSKQRYDPLAAKRVAEILSRLDRTYPDVTCALHHKSAWELLVATILSAQSTDVNVNRVTPELFRKYPMVEAFAAITPSNCSPTSIRRDFSAIRPSR